MTEQPTMFEASTPELRFCGIAMGGYGTYSDLGTDQAVLEIIVPAHMAAGQSIRSINSPAYRREFAEMLTSDITI